MVLAYDNEEVDEMYSGQWRLAPGSFVSSEDLIGRHNIQVDALQILDFPCTDI